MCFIKHLGTTTAPMCLGKKGASYGREPKQRLITRRHFSRRPTARLPIDYGRERQESPCGWGVGARFRDGGVPSEQVWTGLERWFLCSKGLPKWGNLNRSIWWGVALTNQWHHGLWSHGDPPDWLTDWCENITFPQTTYAGGKTKVNTVCHRNCNFVGHNSLILLLTKFNIELVRSRRTYIITTLLTLEYRYVSNKWRVFENL